MSTTPNDVMAEWVDARIKIIHKAFQDEQLQSRLIELLAQYCAEEGYKDEDFTMDCERFIYKKLFMED